jgi:hypothetical protein
VSEARVAARIGRVAFAGIGVGVAEHDHVAALRLPETVAELVHEHAVAARQRRLHRSGWDEEGLHEERLDEERDRESERDEHGKLLEEAPEASTLGLLVARRRQNDRVGRTARRASRGSAGRRIRLLRQGG